MPAEVKTALITVLGWVIEGLKKLVPILDETVIPFLEGVLADLEAEEEPA